MRHVLPIVSKGDQYIGENQVLLLKDEQNEWELAIECTVNTIIDLWVYNVSRGIFVKEMMHLKFQSAQNT